jgi:myo-inositol-1(or 4)-monophosphatase
MLREIRDLLELSKDTARIALDKLTELGVDNQIYSFDKTVPREVKSAADTIIEKIILDKLAPTGINILSEESGFLTSDRESSLRFIIDPIDGTVNFVRRIAACSISIALFDGDKALFGVIASYPSGNIAWGGREIGSFFEDFKLQVSTIDDSKKGVLCTGFPSRYKFSKKSILSQIDLMSKFGKTRMLGSASQSLLQVAKGSVECYSEQRIMLWDVAAGIALVEGAGGNILITSEENEWSLDIVVSNGVV